MPGEEQCCEFNLQKLVCSNREKLPANLQKAINKIAEEEGYLSHEILHRTISTEGGNYLALLYEVDIKGRTCEGEKETNIFIKYTISDECLKITNISELYFKELFLYRELSVIFTELQIEAGVPLHERFRVVQSYNESSTEAIILKNVAKEGFATFYRMDVMPLKFAELAVQQLARFHGLSFVIQRKRPEYFERKIKTLKQSLKLNDDFRAFCRTFFNYSVEGLDTEVRKKLEQALPKLLENYIKYLKGDEMKVKCLCHGDYRMNNVLMKLVEGEVTEVIPVDFQLLHYGPPIIDFIYFVFGATDKEFRRNHLIHMKDMYFETMDNFLKYFEIDIGSVYPRKEFETDFVEYLDYGLQFMLFIFPLVFTLESDVPDFNKNETTDVKVNLDHRFYDRLQGVVDDMIQYGKL
ncbi:unnamed protein product [Parnassius apollo]|uniref:(apollo) hypothetical protein n=1 Tax=Parnassius apollo TaxID=110799 RepID=A0A8S3W8D1_PARAO|nr:unnamed protein product [Parnassius apollo]